MAEKVIAKRTDWEISEMPARCKRFKLERRFTEDQLKTLRYGNIPKEMEDKWFWYMEGNTLYAHRSWSGICIFIIEINEATGIHRVTVNRDKREYSGKSVKEDIELINSLLDWWEKPDYDYYEEWLEETVEGIRKSR